MNQKPHNVDVLRLDELESKEINHIIDLAIDLKKQQKKGKEKPLLQNKTLGITREVGLIFDDQFGKPGKVEKSDTHNFVPTFFITNNKLIKKGIFHDIKIINPFTMEECMGVSATNFFDENNYDFFEQSYIIADYAYPKFIHGLEYKSDRTILPRYVDVVVNAFRRFKTKFS